jgi:hypothetical protein
VCLVYDLQLVELSRFSVSKENRRSSPISTMRISDFGSVFRIPPSASSRKPLYTTGPSRRLLLRRFSTGAQIISGRCSCTAGNEASVNLSKAMLHHWQELDGYQSVFTFERQQERRSDILLVVCLIPLPISIPVIHCRNRPPGTRPAIHEKECRRIPPSRGHQ